MYYDFSVAVDFICDNPDIQAISFVGSDRVGKYIYERGSANGKRVQSNMVNGFTCKLLLTCIVFIYSVWNSLMSNAEWELH